MTKILKAGGKKVQVVEANILATLTESPKSPKEIARAISKTTSYVNTRLKVMVADGRVQLLERVKIPAGCGFAFINIYTADMKPDVAHKIRAQFEAPTVKRDYLQIAFFGEAK